MCCHVIAASVTVHSHVAAVQCLLNVEILDLPQKVPRFIHQRRQLPVAVLQHYAGLVGWVRLFAVQQGDLQLLREDGLDRVHHCRGQPSYLKP